MRSPFTEQSIVVPMGFKAGMPGTYMLTFSGFESFNPNVDISLEDLLTGSVQDIRESPVYLFSNSLQADPDRFLIRFFDGAMATPGTVTGDQVSVYASGGGIMIVNKAQGNLTGAGIRI